MTQSESSRSKLFSLKGISQRLPKPVAYAVRAPLESLLCFPRLNALYNERAGSRYDSSLEFMQQVLDTFHLNIRVSPGDLARIPTQGSFIAVANHPYGALEGMILMSVLSRVRPDVKIMANHLLGHIPEMRPLFIFVDPFETEQSTQANVKGLKESIRWLRDGKAMGVFPSGEVSHLNLRRRSIIERDWTPHIASLARKTNATILPIHFAGTNSPVFHMAGLIHPRLRTALLPREVFNKTDTTVRVRIGTPIRPERLQAFSSDRKAIRYMQLRTEILKERRGVIRRKSGRRNPLLKLALRKRENHVEPIAAKAPDSDLLRELRALPPEAKLAANGSLCAYVSQAHQDAPNILKEIGRLREIAFRAVGEGSGKAVDLDQFDRYYHHLFIWDHEADRLVGAYRLGLSEALLELGGMDAFYSNTLFRISSQLFEKTGPAVELGRSFIRPEYQRSFTPLMLLWKGIGGFLAQHPEYHHLIGPVSISNDYKKISKAMMVRYLSKSQNSSPLSRYVRPRTPFPMRRYGRAGIMRLARMVHDVKELGDVIGDIEPDGKGVPILIKQYLQLGAKSLAFNVDPDFGYCLDVLCIFDVTRTEPRALAKYMGKENATKFMTYHHMADRNP